MKQLATGACSMLFAVAGVAHAGDRQQQSATEQDGRSSPPASHTSSGAPDDPTMTRSSSVGQGSSVMGTPGMNRTQIEQVQRELQARGLYSGAIDGIAGPQTMASVQQFQAQQGLPASGTLDDATRRALGVQVDQVDRQQLDRQPVSGSQASSSPELERAVGREGRTPTASGAKPMRSQVQLDRLNQDQLRTLQSRLGELGFYQGSVDGLMGDSTRSALRQFFQTQADLASRGIITDATISLFGFSPHGLNPPSGPAAGGRAPAASSTGQGSTRATPPRVNETRDGTNMPDGTSMPRTGTGGATPQPTNPSQGTP